MDALTWDEPTGCSPRGWLQVSLAAHPDGRGDRARYALPLTGPDMAHVACGWYLDYSESQSGPDGRHVLASAYMFRYHFGAERCVHLGNEWFGTVPEAKAYLEARAAGYLASPTY